MIDISIGSGFPLEDSGFSFGLIGKRIQYFLDGAFCFLLIFII